MVKTLLVSCKFRNYQAQNLLQDEKLVEFVDEAKEGDQAPNPKSLQNPAKVVAHQEPQCSAMDSGRSCCYARRAAASASAELWRKGVGGWGRETERSEKTKRDAAAHLAQQQFLPGSTADAAGWFQVGALDRSFYHVGGVVDQLWTMAAGSASGLLNLPTASTVAAVTHTMCGKPHLSQQLMPDSAGQSSPSHPPGPLWAPTG